MAEEKDTKAADSIADFAFQVGDALGPHDFIPCSRPPPAPRDDRKTAPLPSRPPIVIDHDAAPGESSAAYFSVDAHMPPADDAVREFVFQRDADQYIGEPPPPKRNPLAGTEISRWAPPGCVPLRVRKPKW